MSPEDDLFASMSAALQPTGLYDSDLANPLVAPGQLGQLANPLLFGRQATERRVIIDRKRQALEKLIPKLPAENESWLILSNGSGRERQMGRQVDQTGFDFGTYVIHLAGLMGVDARVHVSTWVANRDFVLSAADMLASGGIGYFVFFSDPFFHRKRSTSGTANLLKEVCAAYAPRASYRAFANHAKLLLVATADESKTVTITSSANLSAVARVEQFTVDGNRQLYQQIKTEFFDYMLRKVKKPV